MPDSNPTWGQLSSTTSQVLLCDLQKQIVARSKTVEPKALGKSAGVLLQIAQLFCLPSTLSVVPEEEKAPEVIPELTKIEGGAPHILRGSASPFSDPATRKALRAHNRGVLIVAGFAIEVVVLHAVIDALTEGYQVVVPVDACGGMSVRTEDAAIRQMEAAGAATSSVASIATKLAPDFTTEQGKQMFGIVQQLRLA